MKRLLPATILAFLVGAALGQGRHALLIGINQYIRPQSPVPGAWRNDIHDLHGCENDADAMREVLIDIYGWRPEEITELKSDQATRGAILGGLDTLASESARGDTVLFFYSGHGSTVKNSKSSLHLFTSARPSGFGVSNTIVPADTLTGAPDITDKRLATKFDSILDKGARLTAVFDSCFSGEIAREASPGITYKDVPPPELDSIDVQEPDLPDPQIPANRGAVILSASRYWEHSAEESIGGVPRGAFAWALTETLSANEGTSDIESVFAMARSKVKSLGLAQEPTLDALPSSVGSGFLGEQPGKGGIRVPVISRDGDAVVIGGGEAIGLHKGALLTGSVGDTNVTIEIDTEPTVARAHAIYKSGAKDLLASISRYRVTAWATDEIPGLKVYIPVSEKSIQELETAARLTPNSDQPVAKEFGASLQFAGPSLVSRSPKGSPFDYSLRGKLVDGNLCYAWVASGGRPVAVPSGIAEVKNEQCLACQSAEMPQQTAWVDARDVDAADKLGALALKLAALRNWLSLTSHDDPGAFPYQLALVDQSTGKPVPLGADVSTSGRYRLALERVGTKDGASEPRHIYIFEVDPSYAGNLIFPGATLPDRTFRFSESEERMTTSFGFQTPLGTEDFILVATTDPLPLGIFTFAGITEPARESSGPLESLIRMANGAKRDGAPLAVPTGWSIQRITFTSKPGKA